MTKSWVVHYDNKLAAQAKNFAYAKNISAMKEFKFMNAIKIYMIIYYECKGALPDIRSNLYIPNDSGTSQRHVRCQLGILMFILIYFIKGNPSVRSIRDLDLLYPPIQPCTTLLLPHSVQRLPERVIFVSLLTQTRSCHFVWVRNAGGDCLGNGASHHEFQEVP